MNAGVMIVTSNVKDFRRAADELGLTIITPAELVARLAG